MTSQSSQSRPSVRDRLSGSFSSGSSRRSQDPEARFTRNVTIAFVAIIVATLAIIVIAFVYGFWEANLKPLANVNGTEIGRGAWEDRQRLQLFRADRADGATRAALAAGEIDEELANRRLTESTEIRSSAPSVAMEDLVRLTHQAQLAEERGITLGDDELAAALAADGSFPEMRRISALVIQPRGSATGQATAQDYVDARARAQEAHAALVAETPLVDLVDEYSPATAANDGDLGFASREDLRANTNIDPVWADQLFAQEEGAVGDIVEAQNGDQLIGVITAIVPEMADPEFLNAVNEELGEELHERNVRLEATARKLEDVITAEATQGDAEQVRLAEILVAGDAFAEPELDEGSVRASHILYTPETAEAEASAAPGASPGLDASPAADASAAPGTEASAEPSISPAASASPAPESSPAAPATAGTSSAASALPSLSADLLIASVVDMAPRSESEAAALASASPAASSAAGASIAAAGSPSPLPAASAPSSPVPTLAASAVASPAPSAAATPASSPDPDASAGPSADPAEEAAWEAARAKAEATAAELRAIGDVPARMAAFAELAARDGTDSTAQTGGDLGFFARGDMLPEFADPLFDTEGLQQGDIIGPVRSGVGWHVIMFDEARPPLAERLAAVEAALAEPDADFATLARELSDGPTATQGGEIGWQVTERLDDLARMAVAVLGIGEHSQAIDGERGYTFYQKLEEATRPIEPAQAARIAQTAFGDWYDELRFQAEDEGRIHIDDSVYGEAEGVSLDG